MSETAVSSITNTVVTSDGAIAPVVVTENTTVTVETGVPTVVLAGTMGPPGTSTLSALSDVDTSILVSGSLLIYSQATQRWVSSNLLDKQVLEAGQF